MSRVNSEEGTMASNPALDALRGTTARLIAEGQTPIVANTLTPELRKAWRFHHEHGGYCTPPGRAAGALQAARAELEGKARGWEIRCEDDADGWDPGARADAGPYYVAVLVAPAEHWNEEDEILQVLGGVDVSDAEAPDYWRVLYADLAGEALAEQAHS